jgi:hypothetical protein
VLSGRFFSDSQDPCSGETGMRESQDKLFGLGVVDAKERMDVVDDYGVCYGKFSS